MLKTNRLSQSSLAKFKEYINSYKHKDIFNSYSKHFIKNLINITNNLTSDYVQAHRLYNYSIIKNLSNKPLITNVGVSHSLPLGDSLTKLHLITSELTFEPNGAMGEFSE